MPECLCQMDTVAGMWVCLIPGCRNAGTHHAPGGSERDRLCCVHYQQFVAHLLDPVHNLTFPLPRK